MCLGTMCRPMSYLYDSMWRKKRGEGTLNLISVVFGSTTLADSSTSCTSLPHFTFAPYLFSVFSE